MKVLKFGGTSVADSKSINKVISILNNNDDNLFIIVSAFGGVTNLLQECLNLKGKQTEEILKKIESRHLEVIDNLSTLDAQSSLKSFLKEKLNELEDILDAISTIDEVTQKTVSKVLTLGEILSSSIIFEILKQKSFDISYIDSREVIYSKSYDNNEVLDNDRSSISIKNKLDLIKSKLIIAPGYICSNENNEISNLGRGGSDYSAAIFAKYSNAKSLEIWTDVSGVYSANPKIVKKALPIEYLTYKEAMELSFFGAKVIYFPTLQPLIEENIPVYIKNTFEPNDDGTCISNSTKLDKDEIVKGISHIENISILNFEGSGMVGVPGFSKRFFESLSTNKINVIMITQASSEFSICIAVDSNDAISAKKVIDKEFEFEISQNRINQAQIESNLSNIAIVGDKMKSKKGVSGRLFNSLGQNNINIRAIAQGASERNISIIIDEANTKKALNSLHETFFEENLKDVHIFITGVGNVGGYLIEQIKIQKEFIATNLKINLKVLGISNSKKMLVSESEIDLNNWKEKLDESTLKANRETFFDHIKKLNLRITLPNSIRADAPINRDKRLTMFKYMVEAGFAKIGISAEHGDQEFLDKVESLLLGLESAQNANPECQHPKFMEMKKTILSYTAQAEEHRCKVLVFAETRRVVMELSCRINSDPDFISNNICCDFLLGSSSKSHPGRPNGLQMSQDKQLQKLENFKYGKVDVLVATTIAEEGIDITKCNLVIQYDVSPSGKCLQQRAGRARALNSVVHSIYFADACKKFDETKALHKSEVEQDRMNNEIQERAKPDRGTTRLRAELTEAERKKHKKTLEKQKKGEREISPTK